MFQELLRIFLFSLLVVHISFKFSPKCPLSYFSFSNFFHNFDIINNLKLLRPPPSVVFPEFTWNKFKITSPFQRSFSEVVLEFTRYFIKTSQEFLRSQSEIFLQFFKNFCNITSNFSNFRQ